MCGARTAIRISRKQCSEGGKFTVKWSEMDIPEHVLGIF
jgi:hypothetical protein